MVDDESDVPLLRRLYVGGTLMLDEMVTQEYSLENIDLWVRRHGVRRTARRSSELGVLAVTIRSLNHAVLFVSDVERSTRFYCTVLGFEQIGPGFPGGVFLRGTASGNDHDLGLFQASAPGPQHGAVGLFHLAWEVETLNDLAEAKTRLDHEGASSGAADHASTKALYGTDPDGIEFEITWLVPDALIGGELVPGVAPTRPLDIDAEIARYGAHTPGGPRTDRDTMTRLIARLTSGHSH